MLLPFRIWNFTDPHVANILYKSIPCTHNQLIHILIYLFFCRHLFQYKFGESSWRLKYFNQRRDWIRGRWETDTNRQKESTTNRCVLCACVHFIHHFGVDIVFTRLSKNQFENHSWCAVIKFKLEFSRPNQNLMMNLWH